MIGPTIFWVPQFLAGLTSILVAFYLWRRRSTPGAKTLLVLMIATAEWAFLSALHKVSPDLSTKILIAKIQYLGIMTVPPALLAFVLQFTGRERWLTARNLVLLAIFPAITLALAWTNEAHRLIWKSIWIDISGSIPIGVYDYGPCFWIWTSFSYLAVFLSTVFLIRAFIDSPRFYRIQILIMLIGIAAPLVANGLYLLNISPWPLIDLTPIAFTVTGLALGCGMFWVHILDIVPVAHATVFKRIPDGVIVLDDNKRIVNLNPAARKILCLPNSGIIGQSALQIFANQPTLIEHLGDVTEVLSEITLGEGDTQHYYDLLISPLKDRKGSLMGRLITLRDITDRKQAEEALRESEGKYRGLVETTDTGYLIVDEAGRVIDANPEYVRLTGHRTLDEILGRSVVEWTATHDQERNTQEVKKCMEQRFVRNLEIDYVDGDGLITPIEINAKVVETEDGLRILSLCRDITDRKRAEEALRKSEKSYRELINSITDFIYSHDLAGRFTMVNRTATKTLGYIPEDLIGHPISDFMLPEHSQAFKEEYLPQIKEKGSLGGLSIYLAKDGSKRYIEYRNVLVKQEGMEPFISGSGRDITEKVLSDRKVHRLHEQLQRAQKMEAIGTLAGGVAHDLNNVLSGIVSYPELLLLDIPEDSPLRKPILTIQKSGKKAADIVQDLLTLARRGVVATEVVNLNQIINSYLKSPECENLKKFYPDAKIESDLEMNLLNIMGSPVHLSKSVMNLVNNAAEAMPDGGNIFISTESRYIDKPLRGYDDVEEGDYVILTVSDTGIGISSEDMERIFEPFYTKKVMGRSGTGLGMAVVWGTVKDHRGYIDVQSTEGKGTTFTLYFPVSRKEITGKEEALPMEEYMGKEESILVVDDVEEQREIASRILTKLNYAVTSVSSGEEAVDYMKDNSADLLVLDMIMDPGIDGLETYKRILELHPGQKAIIASGFSETDRVKEAQRLGAGKYIKKPYTLEKIGLAVKEELE